jgi:site-specific DNA recombinase
MKAALYCRVSTDMQADNFSIAAQTNLLQEYCTRNNVEIVDIFVDEMSGQKEQRPEFQRMIKAAESKEFNLILVHKFDRFARKVELSQRIKRQLRVSNVNVVSITEPIEDSPIGFFTEGIMELLAEYYVRNLAQESKKGHIERASQGFHNGSVPYGYKNINKELVINPEQADVVKQIYDMYVYQGFGSTKISRILNEMNIPTAVNGQWSQYTINHILKNVKYIGKIYYNGNVYQGHHESIITEEVFNLTQKYMKDRTWNREYRGANYPKFLLSGILRCGECGHVMKIQKNTSGKRKASATYYTCNNASHTDRIHRCDHSKGYSTFKVEDEFTKALSEIFENINAPIYKRDIPSDFSIERKIKLEKELQRAKQAYLSGVFTLDEYADTKQKTEKELNEIIVQPKQVSVAEIKTLLDSFENAPTIPEKKTMLKKFIKNVTIRKGGDINIDFVM